jgi:membrane protease YdiL (CAAX protease family)
MKHLSLSSCMFAQSICFLGSFAIAFRASFTITLRQEQNQQATYPFRVNKIIHHQQQQQQQQQQHQISIFIRYSRGTKHISSKNNNDVDPEQKSTDRGSIGGINFSLILQNIANQALIGSTIWTGGSGYEVLLNNADFSFFNNGIVLGIVGVVPMLALSRAIETSESYIVSGLNLSTNAAVLRLFGPTSKPIIVFVLSAFLACLTGVVEEVTFRGQLSQVFANNFGDGNVVVGVILSTLLFAILHTNPLSFIQGSKEAKLDNFVLLLLQLVNGSYFAWLYLSTNNNLAVPIVTHAAYDFYTFYKTHIVDVGGQMDYASRASTMPQYKSRQLVQKWTTERGIDFVKGVQQTFYLMDTNRDGVLSRKELRIALFSYGINLSQNQSIRVTQQADLDQSGGIELDEFLQFVGPAGSTGKAVRNTLFGPL